MNKPVAYIDPYDLERLPHYDCHIGSQQLKNGIPLYTHPVKEQSNLINVVKKHIEDLMRCVKLFRSYEMDNTADEMEVAIKELENAIDTHPVKEQDESFDRTASHMAGEYVSYKPELIDDKKKKYFPFQLKNHVLTDEEIMDEYKFGDNHGSLEFARAIESMVVHRLKVKELTDEEIKEVLAEYYLYNDRIYDFARAILRKAQENG